MTRFQRLNLALGIAALMGLAAAASASKAQTFEEAVRANVALALSLCVAPSNGIDPALQRFRDAGFAERIESSGGDHYHYFTAPAETAEVEFYWGHMASHCRVSTSHMGVTVAATILDLVVPAYYPGYTRLVEEGGVDPATGQPTICVRYQQPNSEIPHVIGVTSGGGAEACIENGTSTFFDVVLV